MAGQEFDLQDFVENPSYDKLINISKKDWRMVANHYEITLRSNWVKEVMKNTILEDLVSINVLSSDAIPALTPMGLSLRTAEKEVKSVVKPTQQIIPQVDQLELEKLRLEYQYKMAENEKEIRLAELEVRKLEAIDNQEVRRREVEVKEAK